MKLIFNISLCQHIYIELYNSNLQSDPPLDSGGLTVNPSFSPGMVLDGTVQPQYQDQIVQHVHSKTFWDPEFGSLYSTVH